MVLEGNDEMLILVFDEALSVADGVLWISFSGVLNEHMRGFYKGYSLLFLFLSFVSVSQVFFPCLILEKTRDKLKKGVSTILWWL